MDIVNEESSLSDIHTVTLVLEFNYANDSVCSTSGSVWIFNGDGDSTIDSDSALSEIPNWVKVVGPIDYEIAAAVHAGLKKFFEQNGVPVIDRGIAD